MFREQVTTVCNWFDRWSPCEQTVAMVAMLRRLQPTQARFLTSVLNRQISDCTELRRTEILANDPNFVASLNNTESKESLMRDLLTHLPLLNPKNSDVKSLYLALIPKVLKYVLDHCTLVEEARQLLSYSLIHPAFTTEDRGLFSTWLHQFDQLNNTLSSGPSGEQGLSSSSHYPPSGSPPSNELGSAWQHQQQQGNMGSSNNTSNLSGSPGSHGGLSSSGNYGTNYQRIRRSNSLTPPVLHSDAWASQEELCSAKPRSLSLSSEVSPQSSLASSGSGSETHLDDPRPTFTSPGMKGNQSRFKLKAFT
ncbi:Protein Smaug 1 [Orchesella cincta]|uniref:Protein Smaug 1 n=1 Tax=Orchesella cincta TaxID=48709 RepID=A0A1D2NCS2_ORCCI|nr:Protein Smaug 1 [Orchesella cincta]